ncbi:MAG: LPXTG cell wall anchor domain-containing protein [Acidobacteria bacterium]|nr:MAG: LPXTG cell wall anchor domain-containing protein [Acidobacteriota bacterium]
MRSRTLAVLALSIAVLAPAAFAQQNGTQSEAASGAMAPAQAGDVEVTGTIVSINATSVQVKLDSVTAAQGVPLADTVAVGKTVEFKLDASTQMPRTLSAGDPIDLSFKSDDGSLVATRLALAVSADQPATAASGSPSEEQASTAGTATPATAPQAAHAQHLPKTGSPLPLIGLLGAAALIAAFALRFIVRV